MFLGLAKEPPLALDTRWRGTYFSALGLLLVLDEEVPIKSVKKEFNDTDGLVVDVCWTTKAAAVCRTQSAKKESFIVVTIVVLLRIIKQRISAGDTHTFALDFSRFNVCHIITSSDIFTYNENVL